MNTKVQTIVDVIDGLKGEEILVLDFEKKSSLCDKVVICTARSNKNAQAIADELEEKLGKIGEKKLGLEGYNDGDWILMDYDDIIVHIFLRETREYYKLEQLWSFAKEEYRA
jgi:ribosome-associated protein